jgi:hypothetical protein
MKVSMQQTIKIDFKVGWKGVEWIQLAQDKVQWRTMMCMEINLRSQ